MSGGWEIALKWRRQGILEKIIFNVLNSSSSFEEFVDIVCEQVSFDRELLLLLNADGTEVDSSNFDNACVVYLYLSLPTNEYLALPRLPSIPSPMESKNVFLPPIGSMTASMDSQTNALQVRLGIVYEHLATLKSIATDINTAAQALSSAATILTESAHVAEENFNINRKIISEKLEDDMKILNKIMESVEILLHRCPMDFALMKRIPILKGLFKNKFSGSPVTLSSETGDDNLSLFCIKGKEWQEIYKDSLQQRGNITFSMT